MYMTHVHTKTCYKIAMCIKQVITRMWADAQRDGCPAEYMWRHLRKFRNFIPCTTPQSLADARWSSAMQQCCQYRRTQDLDAK